MLQNTATEAKYKLFIEKTAASNLVWGLKNKDGWANSHSADDEAIHVIPFWSDKADAKVCARNEWKGYLPAMIPLSEFLESGCVGMSENDTLAGINWDANMLGLEMESLQVAFDILTQLKSSNSTIKFKVYSSVDEFLSAISESTN
jgi:hypothetical protein